MQSEIWKAKLASLGAAAAGFITFSSFALLPPTAETACLTAGRVVGGIAFLGLAYLLNR